MAHTHQFIPKLIFITKHSNLWQGWSFSSHHYSITWILRNHSNIVIWCGLYNICQQTDKGHRGKLNQPPVYWTKAGKWSNAASPGEWIRNGEVSRESYLWETNPLLYPGVPVGELELRDCGALEAEHRNETVDKQSEGQVSQHDMFETRQWLFRRSALISWWLVTGGGDQ